MKVKDIDGLPIINATEPLILSVTENDVRRADLKEPANCAVARACHRQLHVQEARVHLGRVYLRFNKGNWVRYVTPPSMRQEIITFDRGGKFAAGEYHLYPVPPKKRLGGTQGSKTRPKKPTGKKRTKPHVVADVRGGPA